MLQQTLQVPDKVHVITIENHSDSRVNDVSVLNTEDNKGLTYTYHDAEGNNDYVKFIASLKEKKEKIVRFRMHANCEYRKFREKQINQWVTLKNIKCSLACPLRIDPFQFQSDVVEFPLENTQPNFRLDDLKMDLVLQYLMPDTTIQFTILTTVQQ